MTLELETTEHVGNK